MAREKTKVAPRWSAPYNCNVWYIGGEAAWVHGVEMVKNGPVALKKGDLIKSVECDIEYEKSE
jgi:hypothetical protein